MFGLSPLPRTLDAALRDLEHDKFHVRLSAIRDLAKLSALKNGAAAQTALIRALRDDPAPGIRAEAALALADADSKGALPELIAAAGDEHERVRQMVLVALGELTEHPDPFVLAIIERARRDETPEVRFQALLALHRVAPEQVNAALLEGTRDTDPEVRQIAFRIAEERWAGAARESVSETLIERARESLSDKSLSVQLSAAMFLARVSDRSGAEIIARVVNARRREVPLEDEQGAVELAGELGLRAAEPGLRRRAFGLFGVSRDNFAWQARVALARLGDDRARASILKGLQAWTRDTRTMAVAAAGSARLCEARSLISQMASDPKQADPETVAEALRVLDAREHSHDER